MDNKKHRLKGMTLTELLVVLAILGVLLLMAFPVLKPLFSKTHSLEAKTNLKHLAELQKIHFLEATRYANEFYALGFEQAKLVSEPEGTAHYEITILTAGNDNFLARASSITDFDGDGTLNVWEVDKSGIPKEVVPD
ncbi:MAG: prepilin-type N-terminal cleavage/methylation domain-containing protein [Bacteroidota bacterium]